MDLFCTLAGLQTGNTVFTLNFCTPVCVRNTAHVHQEVSGFEQNFGKIAVFGLYFGLFSQMPEGV
jgi:hypothetical protein